MKDYKAQKLVLFSIFLLFLISCNSQKQAVTNEDFTVLESVKTPLSGGANVQGMKIAINVNAINNIQFDSIVYNSRSSSIELKKDKNDSVWLVSHFYNQKTRIKDAEAVEYKAEGDTCEVYYTLDKKVKKVVIPQLALKQENIEWE